MTETAYLIDTQIVIWSTIESGRLDKRHREILERDQTWISMASLWEISIKRSLGKLNLPVEFVDGVLSSRSRILPISVEHVEAVRGLPHHHRDPFDRMLIAQAQVEGLTILTTDRHFASYEVALA